MVRFALVRGLSAIAVLFLLISATFVLQSVVPGDPVRAKVGANASQATVDRMREEMGLNEPLSTQYVNNLKDVAKGNLGVSIRTGQPVTADIGRYLPASLELAGAAIFAAVVAGGFLGVLAATASRGAGLIRLVFVAGASAPTFLLGFILIYFFYLRLGWLPASGQSGVPDPPSGPTGMLVVDGLLAGRPAVTLDAMKYLVLPALSLALLPTVAIGRILRTSLDTVYEADHIRTARAKGLSKWRVLSFHALKNGMSAPLTMLGLQFGLMLGGIVVAETIFAWPGIGLYLQQSIAAGDLPAIAGVTMILAAIYVLVNILVDFGQTLLDPRLRL